MVQFKNFELNNSEMIYGGTQPTMWSDGENTGPDVYDSATGRIVYF